MTKKKDDADAPSNLVVTYRQQLKPTLSPEQTKKVFGSGLSDLENSRGFPAGFFDLFWKLILRYFRKFIQ
jgi:hypothetical protein